MAASQSLQLESAMDEVLKNGNVQILEAFIERSSDQETLTHCSPHFLDKLDELVSKSLEQNDGKAASLGFASLHKLGKHLKLPHGEGLSEFMNKGLVQKWFEKCKELWITCGPRWDEALFSLSENFLNALMVVHEASREGTMKITEHFLYPVGQLAVDPRIYILIQKEAIRKYNLILDKIPMELKKRRKILTSQESSDIMTKLAGRIMKGGDYDLQSSLMEALCRMATPALRKKLADQWFTLGHVATAFSQITDSEFETTCRKFLNMVNGMQGEKRRVCSYPCLEVFLGKYELLMPSDENLEEFWIDFNLDSRSITFYCSLPEEKEGHWETICINENEVESYSVTEEKKRQVLKIKLSEVVVVGEVEGSRLVIYFSCALDILQAARGVFGNIQNKRTSVSKTAIEMSSTQIVPESQVSLSGSEKTYAAPTSRVPPGICQMVTPSRMKVSESTGFVRTSASGKVNPDYFAAFKSSDKDKGRSSVQTASVCDTTVRISTNAGGIKQKKTPEAEATEMFVADQKGEPSQEHEIVPDTQHRAGLKTSSNLSKLSISEILTMPTQKVCSLPQQGLVGPQQTSSSRQKNSVSHPNLAIQKQFHSELTLRLQQVQRERSTDPPLQQPVMLLRKTPNTRGRSKDRSCGNLGDFPEKKNNTKEECKGNLETVSAEVKSSTARTTRKRMKDKEKTKMTLSSNEKRNAEVAGNMVKFISSHYDKNTQSTGNPAPPAVSPTQKCIPPSINRPNFNMSWLSKYKGKIPGALSFTAPNQKNTTNSVRPSKDVFEFNLDSPLSVGRKNKTHAEISAISSRSSAVSTTKKARKPETKSKPKSKKHVFSDTEVETTRTEVSWLIESSMKPKKKVNQYQRQAVRKPRANSPHPGQKSPDLLPPTLNPLKGNNKPKTKNPGLKKPVDQPKEAKMVRSTAASSIPEAPGKRPRRGAVLTRSYRELHSDDSLSEPENVPAPKKCSVARKKKNKESTSEVPHLKKKTNIFTDQPEHSDKRERSSSSRSSSSRQSDVEKQPALKLSSDDDLQISPGAKKKTANPAQKRRKPVKDSSGPSKNSSPSSVEKMRSAEGSASTVNLACSTALTPQGSPVPVSPMLPCQGAPSSILLLRKPCSTVSSEGEGKTSLQSSEKNFSLSKRHLGRPESTPCSRKHEIAASRPLNGPKTPEEHLPLKPQPTFYPSTQPLLTSTLLQQKIPPVTSTPQSPYPEDSPGLGCQLDFRKVSTESLDSLSPSSAKSVEISSRSFKESPNVPVTVSIQREQTPLAAQDLDASQPFISGPSRKRRGSMSSNSDEEKKNRYGKEKKKKNQFRMQRSPRIKPRKLFKSFTEVSASEKMSLAVSTSHLSFTHCGSDATDGDVDVDESLGCPDISVNQSSLYQHLNSELKNKLQNRCKVLEVYGKESSKSVKKHISSINVQLNKHRTQRLEHVKEVLLEEIHSMEENENMLNNMEKDLTIFWKKQTGTFKKYQKQEVRRNETLKRALQMNASPSLKYEAEIFTSEMCLIKKDMKSVQDRLLNEMLEGEIQSVKRGLHALFFQ